MFYKERKEKKTVWVYLYRIQLINVDIWRYDGPWCGLLHVHVHVIHGNLLYTSVCSMYSKAKLLIMNVFKTNLCVLMTEIECWPFKKNTTQSLGPINWSKHLCKNTITQPHRVSAFYWPSNPLVHGSSHLCTCVYTHVLVRECLIGVPI